MKKYFDGLLLMFLIFLVFCTSSCIRTIDSRKDEITNTTAKGTRIINGKPEWFWNPGMKGNIGAYGSVGIHVKGENEQKKLAIERALDDIAKQLNVKIDNYNVIATTGTKNDAKTYMGNYSFQTSDNKNISANIEEIWKDEKTGELYVWMVLQ